MGSGFSKRKKEAKEMQDKLLQMQEQIKDHEGVGTAGNGLVTVTLAGDNEMKSIKIKPDCVDPEDIEGLEDLVRAAYEDARQKVESMAPQMPGFQGLF